MKKGFALITILALVVMTVPVAFADEATDLFGKKCAACHAADGKGKMKGTPDMTSADFAKKTDAELTTQIKDGGVKKTASHAFGAKGITDEQIKGLVAHIRTFAAKK